MLTASAHRTGNSREDQVLGLPVDQEILFSNHKIVRKKRSEKRQTALIKKIPFIKPFLQEDEKILLVTTGCSPVSFFEQFVTGWIFVYLKRALFVFTNKRIFHVPTKTGYGYRNSIAHVWYADCESIRLKGHVLIVKYKNGNKEKFIYIAGRERKKIKTLVNSISFAGTPSQRKQRAHLCPRCTTQLEPGRYRCSHCRLTFKDEDEAKRLSIIYPGGGYFYTRHPVLGLADSVVEFLLLLAVISALADVVLNGFESGGGALITFGMVFFIEKLVTIYHSRQFIKEYIPIDKVIKSAA